MEKLKQRKLLRHHHKTRFDSMFIGNRKKFVRDTVSENGESKIKKTCYLTSQITGFSMLQKKTVNILLLCKHK